MIRKVWGNHNFYIFEDFILSRVYTMRSFGCLVYTIFHAAILNPTETRVGFQNLMSRKFDKMCCYRESLHNDTKWRRNKYEQSIKKSENALERSDPKSGTEKSGALLWDICPTFSISEMVI